ncbi:MAG TPA: hypothetical protein VN967_10715 [Burkholderiales bacterium]|nr:hypothetical protein [Burkholderiales bacterium]
MKTAIALVVGVLGPALLVALVAGAALGLVIGILLLVDSERVLRWNAYMNRWISTGNAFSVLDRPRDIKRLVYHWHRVVGLLVVAGALYSVSVLAFGFGTEPLVRSFRDLASPTALRLTVDSLKLFLIAGNVAAILAGLILCFRPSLLKAVEGWADRQYGPPLANPNLDAPRYPPDEFVRAHARLAGALATLGSLFVLVSLGATLLRW